MYMYLLVIGALLAITSYIIGLTMKSRVSQLHQRTSDNSYNMILAVLEEHRVSLGSERAMHAKVVQGIQEDQRDLMQRTKDDLIADVLAQKAQAEAHIKAKLEGQLAQVKQATETAVESDRVRHEALNADVAAKMASAHEEYEKLDKVFMATQESDATRHLLACAYSVVVANRAGQDDAQHSALKNAVMRHRKEGGPMVPKSPGLKGKVPSSGDLN